MDTFVLISLKTAKLRYTHCYYFCMLGYVARNYHPTKFGSNCEGSVDIWIKLLKKLLTGGQKFA